MGKRVGGIIEVKVDGSILNAKGNFDYNIGKPKKEAVVGMDAVHGYKETPQAPYIEGTITDTTELNLATLLAISDSTVTLRLANGKSVVLRKAWFAAEGKVNTEEGEIECRFEGMSAEEVGA